MGVRGLTTIINKAGLGRDLSPARKSGEYDTVAIDASALVYWLLPQKGRLWGLGTSFRTLYRVMIDFLVPLLESRWGIVLFMDGTQQEDKEATRRMRYRKQAETENQFHRYLITERSGSPSFVLSLF